MAPRVVLDTNVVVAALRSRRGASAAVLLGAGTGQFEFCISVALFFEYESVLKRPEAGVVLPVAAIDDILDHLAAVGRREQIFFLWRPVLPDPADDHVLEVAVAGRCDTIVTYNRRDFRGVGQFGLRIVSPSEFLLELRREEP